MEGIMKKIICKWIYAAVVTVILVIMFMVPAIYAYDSSYDDMERKQRDMEWKQKQSQWEMEQKQKDAEYKQRELEKRQEDMERRQRQKERERDSLY